MAFPKIQHEWNIQILRIQDYKEKQYFVHVNSRNLHFEVKSPVTVWQKGIVFRQPWNYYKFVSFVGNTQFFC